MSTISDWNAVFFFFFYASSMKMKKLRHLLCEVLTFIDNNTAPSPIDALPVWRYLYYRVV